MRTITIVSVIAVLLLEVVGAIPHSSVLGPVTFLLLFFIAMMAVGLHDAWSNGRGVLGWIVSIVVSVLGGFLAVGAGGMVMETLLMNLNLGQPYATSQHPLRYVASVGLMLFTLLGCWAALQIVNRFRDGARRSSTS